MFFFFFTPLGGFFFVLFVLASPPCLSITSPSSPLPLPSPNNLSTCNINTHQRANCRSPVTPEPQKMGRINFPVPYIYD
ncbi:hypothetical protein B0F90DRAFT_1721492 [Multifurca ochricompacta]|uniref:Secreted protein n=1 Tax=Multifurca ochricompacta TaxID=376703 RepID=A0AAD4M676_9AGAM|nr:hypothetical protein B0F90DRAFT_1721492 [Multifurca ochricompacta]